MTDDIQAIEMAVLRLVQRFVDRQSIPFEAIKALRPALIEATHIRLDQQKLASILTRYIDEPWQGQWQEWIYSFQGAGCRLIHDETREIIEWEICDLNTFDRYWFVNWIEWLFIFHPNDQDLALLTVYYQQRPHRYGLYDVLFPMLRLLRDEGHLTHDNKSKNVYTLVKQSSVRADTA